MRPRPGEFNPLIDTSCTPRPLQATTTVRRGRVPAFRFHLERTEKRKHASASDRQAEPKTCVAKDVEITPLT